MIPDNARLIRITAAAGTYLAETYSLVTALTLHQEKGVYNPKAFFPHAASLRQAFAHCAISLAAASRRSQGRLSFPVWLTMLSDQLPVYGLVGRYPTNNLIGHKPLLKRPKALIPATYHWSHMRY